MNFEEALSLNSTMPHEEKYTTIINALGYTNVKKCIPFSLEQIKTALQEDENLNNLPLSKWDRASGFMCNDRTGSCILIRSQLTNLYSTIGVTYFSCSDGVCILKQCAKMWTEEE